ncbi:NADAR family protein [Calothrix sp. 336/3]|uniref:NADAR family protein n=1 Tax=Calothrix sp. 336/3 TaxID=1337936 RepID=UPI0004E2BBE9|nr:NADAR domain-containing protein [Calothrix sp. 336/3]AKG24009.1 Swarming motility protein ybiA [Calothrix sp. 336/3]
MTIYFYKAWQPYGCFSNFSYHGIKMQDTYWSTVEHYYQAQKFVGTKDAAIIPVIRVAETPEQAAALGRCSDRQVRSDWEKVKTDVMYQAVFAKFIHHKDIQEILCNTGDELLIENSPVDYFWGCGANQTGENQLGKILMRVRTEIFHLMQIDTYRSTSLYS